MRPSALMTKVVGGEKTPYALAISPLGSITEG